MGTNARERFTILDFLLLTVYQTESWKHVLNTF